MAYCAVHSKSFPDIAPSCPWCSGELDEHDDDFEDEECEDCTCDITGEDGCPLHYPIDDGSDDDDCMDCGICDECLARTKAFYEEMEMEKALELDQKKLEDLGAFDKPKPVEP